MWHMLQSDSRYANLCTKCCHAQVIGFWQSLQNAGFNIDITTTACIGTRLSTLTRRGCPSFLFVCLFFSTSNIFIYQYIFFCATCSLWCLAFKTHSIFFDVTYDIIHEVLSISRILKNHVLSNFSLTFFLAFSSRHLMSNIITWHVINWRIWRKKYI